MAKAASANRRWGFLAKPATVASGVPLCAVSGQVSGQGRRRTLRHFGGRRPQVGVSGTTTVTRDAPLAGSRSGVRAKGAAAHSAMAEAASANRRWGPARPGAHPAWCSAVRHQVCAGSRGSCVRAVGCTDGCVPAAGCALSGAADQQLVLASILAPGADLLYHP